jgi:hypothetical protein
MTVSRLRFRRTVIAGALVALGMAASQTSVSYGAVTHHALFTFDGSNGTEQIVLNDAVDNSVGPSSGDVYAGLGTGVIMKFDASGVYAGVEITGSETPAGSFSFLAPPYSSGIAVDGSTGTNAGDVYVADIEHGVIDRFNEAGHYLCQITGTESPSLSECNGVAGSKTTSGSMTPRGVAVDASGNLYVADSAHGVIDKFGPKGNFIEQITDPISEPGPIAVDPSGHIYVGHGSLFAPGGVEKFASNGTVIAAPALEALSAQSVAVDPSNGNLLAGESGAEIAEFEASGAKLDAFGSGGLALAVDGSTGKVYANTFIDPTIEVYGPLLILPDVTTEAATEVQERSATLNGFVTPDSHDPGGITECQFEYGTTTAYGQTVPCSAATKEGLPYKNPTAVSGSVSLEPSTSYHFRLTASDAGGTAEGADQTLTTTGPPGVIAEAATPGATEAGVRAEVNPFGFTTGCHVQYVEDAAFKSSGYSSASTVSCEPANLAAEIGYQRVSAHIGGLHVSTVYHFRFLTENSSGTTAGADQTFVTFGIKEFGVEVLNKDETPYTQAGGHPYKMVTNFEFNGATDVTGLPATDANPKDIISALPAGFIGNVNATPRCTPAELVRRTCSGADQVGVVRLRLDDQENLVEPLYSLLPSPGYPAELGFRISTITNVLIYLKVRTGEDYGVTAESINSSAGVGIEGATIEIWGVPADPNHDPERVCENGAPGCSIHAPLVPFLTDPTACDGPQTETLRANSWQDPADFVSASATLPEITGCGSMAFTPQISVHPDTTVADAPAGLDVALSVPSNETPDGIVQPYLKSTSITLPAGMSVSSAAASGLGACSQAQIGMDNADAPACPDASKIGTVDIDTPVLPDPVKGSVYLAEQDNNPFKSVLALYIAAQADGALVKLAGRVSTDPATGQLTSTFENTPQLPFSEFKLSLFGGPRGSLATNESCGQFEAAVLLTPWSGETPTALESPFAFTSGCVTGFSPAFTAGAVSPQAGAYSPLALTFSRSDTDQELSGLSVSLPPGLLAKTAGVPLCSDADANAGTCPEASQVGAVRTAAGPGSEPLVLDGKAYLTGPYKGAPYGLDVAVPAVAGPFNFGMVVVRQALYIDPHNAHVTAVSDPFPTILDVTGGDGRTDGVPIRLRRVEVSIDRPEFTRNPTNCNQMATSASFTSKEGLTSPASSPFGVANCRALQFTPKFQASTTAQTSKATGASLTTKITFPPATAGPQANIAKVKVDLPIQLPSQDKTLQKACLAAVFESDPANCPSQSIIGHATARTPLLADPLTGPAYFVSHGGEAFPSLTIELQGDGVTFQLVGQTFIKKGITSTTFNTVPDAPVSTFELTLPHGQYSALAAYLPASAHGSFCGQNLKMPTLLVAQNGLEINQQTAIAVTGCKKTQTRAQKLAAALRACSRKSNRSQRNACTRRARKVYGRLS